MIKQQRHKLLDSLETPSHITLLPFTHITIAYFPIRGTPLGPALRRSLPFLRDVYLVEIPLKGVGKGRDKL